MTRTRLDLMALTYTELNNLYLACASALETRSRGPNPNAEELCVPISAEAVKRDEVRR